MHEYEQNQPSSATISKYFALFLQSTGAAAVSIKTLLKPTSLEGRLLGAGAQGVPSWNPGWPTQCQIDSLCVSANNEEQLFQSLAPWGNFTNPGPSKLSRWHGSQNLERPTAARL